MSHETSLVWFITGCSTGFGRALAEEVLLAGERLVATARDVSSLDDLVATNPDTLRVLSLDVTQHAMVQEVVKEAAEVWGRLDVVVNNAGYGLIGALEEYSDAQMQRCLETNLMGPIHVMRAALPILRAQKSGHIINMSAAAAISNYAGFSIYGGAKGALEGISESVRAEVAPLGIKVTLVQPGPFRTDFIARSLDRAQEHLSDYDKTSGQFLGFLERINGKQPGDPVRAAQAIVQMVKEGKAPLRLPLGKYVTDKIKKKLQTSGRELQEWEDVAVGCDFPA
jgi:NAD(P)-dependent dehydrogenase (short-subunit alcohol dehydrogenase family)